MTDKRKELPWEMLHLCFAEEDAQYVPVSDEPCDCDGEEFALVHQAEARALFDLRERVKGGVVLTRKEAQQIEYILAKTQVLDELDDTLHRDAFKIIQSKLSTKEPAGE